MHDFVTSSKLKSAFHIDRPVVVTDAFVCEYTNSLHWLREVQGIIQKINGVKEVIRRIASVV